MSLKFARRWVFIAVCAALPVAAVEPAERPTVTVADAALGCPGVEGLFVTLLDPGRGMLVLAAAPFPGGQPVGRATGAEMRVALADSQPWHLDRVSAGSGPAPLWAARFGFLRSTGSGCVGFDRERFSSEGDLASYARWLVEEIYFRLPAAERERWPALRLSTREVRLRVEREGYLPLRLAGREGATLAFRPHDSEQTLLLAPFVLDPTSGRLALRLTAADQPNWLAAERRELGFVVASLTEPVRLADPPVTVVVEGVGDAPAPPGQ